MITEWVWCIESVPALFLYCGIKKQVMFHTGSGDILSLPGTDVDAHAAKSQFFTVKQTGQEKEKKVSCQPGALS